MDPSLLAFVVTITGLTMIPGATTMLVLRRVMLGGSRASALTIAGGSVGVYVHALIAAAGLSVIFQHNEPLRNIVRTLGALYLLWLGGRSLWRAARGHKLLQDAQGNAADKAGIAAFGEGLITLLLSPEAALFYVSSLSQFVAPDENLIAKALVLASLHAAVRIGWYGLLAIFVSRMLGVMRSPRVQRSIEAGAGMLLIGFALRSLLQLRR